MSKTFTYEIDERRLRLQLRNVDLPLKEEAWAKFESYALAHPLEQPKRSFKNFEFNLNRNVVLPIVFGIIICVFSFMLFNFISIKKPVEQTESKEAVSTAAAAPAEKPATHLATKEISAPVVVEEPAVVPETEPSVDPSESVEAKTPTAATKETKPIVTPPAAENKLVSSPEPEKKSEPAGKPKRKRHSEQQLSEIRPNTVSDEEEVEVVPN